MFGENTKFICVRCASDEEWRQERKRSVGGSDVAAILGISKWQSPTAVYLEKTGKDDDEPDKTSPVMEFGNIMEPQIAAEFKKRHPDILVRRVNAILRPIGRPWAHASLDYECREPDGKWGVLEIKCAASEAEWKSGVPTYYLVQGQHYLATTDRDYVWFVVFFRDSCEIREYRIERDQDLIDTIEGRVDAFWEGVLSATPPTKMSGTEDESAALAKLYAHPQDRLTTVNDPALDGAVIAYENVSSQIKQLEKQKRQLADAICAKIGDSRGLVLKSAKRRVIWVRSERTTYDVARLAQDYPDIVADYARTKVTSGGLRIAKLS